MLDRPFDESINAWEAKMHFDQFYKEHITETLELLKRVYTPEYCDKLQAARGSNRYFTV